MEVEFLDERYDYETCATSIDTEKESTQYLLDIATALVNGDMRIIQYIEPSEKTLGKELFQLYKDIKALEEKHKNKRSEAAKKGWKTKKCK